MPLFMNIPKFNNSDILENGWWNILPKKFLKWIRLGRFDRPVGFWLLLLPGWWVLALTNIEFINCVKLMIVFFVGSVVMRAAGCTINDLWDKDIDKKISRTKNRPIANGDISNQQAFCFLALMLLIGIICLYQLNVNTWYVALSSLPLVIVYPLAKRFTKWPQIILGLTFSWSVPTAWSAASQDLSIGIFIMYFGTVFWIIGYDTIYGCQDKNEDEIFGIQNSAVSAKKFLPTFVGCMYFITFILLLVSGYFLGASIFWFIGVILVGCNFINQVLKLNDLKKNNPLKIFKSNVKVGLILTFFALGNFTNFI
jgi:4-hydroxybenzoate polyprenyltransferase